MVTKVFIAILLLALVVYGGMEALPLLRGPSLVITEPLEGASAPGGFVTIAGVAHRVSSLSLNGAPLLMDESGNFSRLVVLPHGNAILTLTASDRFGRSITKQESVYVP